VKCLRKGASYARRMPEIWSRWRHFQNDFNYIVDVALGIDAAGNREADQIHLCRAREHQSADFYAADSAFQVKFGA